MSDPLSGIPRGLAQESSDSPVPSGNRSSGRAIEMVTAPATPMPFQSILFVASACTDRTEEQAKPEYFHDLNLDQLLTVITAGWEEYNLTPFFYEHLRDEQAVRYRQTVFRDLECPAVLKSITTFAQTMRAMRTSLAQASAVHDLYQQESWFIDAVELYINAVRSLTSQLAEVDLSSEALVGFRAHLVTYVQSQAFTALVAETTSVKDGFSKVDYTIQINGARCTVAKYEREDDYSAEVLRTFSRFQQGAVKDYRVGFREPAEMNHIETKVLGLVAKLYPEPFAALDAYFSSHRGFLDPIVCRFDREVQFYISYLQYLHRLESAGLSFCHPEVTRQTKEVFAVETFDLALADKLLADGGTVVANDFSLRDPERIFVISGPNQGGKTTFARMFGQLHHLAGIGCPVPGRKAKLFLYDELFVQFEREEDLGNMTGKLEDDLVRVKDILTRATSESIVVLNEIFASTTLQDSVFLSTKVMEELIALDALAVFVTFVDELATLAPSVVSMVSTIVPGNPMERTYKVLRRPADGLAYALAIAEKYGVTYENLKKRVLS